MTTDTIASNSRLDGNRDRNANSRLAVTTGVQMTEDSSSGRVPSQPVVVQENTHQNEIPENIDSELYSADSPDNSFHEFKIERGDELVEALRENGYTVEFRDR